MINQNIDHDRYARCIDASKRVRWEIEEDVIRGRTFDKAQKYLPDGLTLLPEFTHLVRGGKTLCQPDPGTHLRQCVRSCRALH